MGTQLIVALAALTQAIAAPPQSPPTKQVAPVGVEAAQVVTATPAAPLPATPVCDARPWQYLVGRTVSDLLTIKLPAGTRIYRLADPPSATNLAGRMSVELNRSTRVRRVYCS
jgi:hypothetical protein